MKKIMTVMAAVSIFFSAIVSVSAATLCRTSGGNGAVKLTINLNDGFAGALDATLELSGKVTLDTIEWDASLAPEYVKKYTYDKDTNTIRLYIATGSETKNLADKDGNITVGVIKVKAAADKEKFNVGIKRLSVTNMDYEVRQITTLENDKTDDFTYQLEDLNNGDNNGDHAGDKDDNNSDNNNSGDENNNGGQNGNGSNGADKDNTADNEKNEAIKNNLGNSEPSKNNSATGSYDSVNTGSETSMVLYLGIMVIVFLSAGGYIVYRKNQKA